MTNGVKCGVFLVASLLAAGHQVPAIVKGTSPSMCRAQRGATPFWRPTCPNAAIRMDRTRPLFSGLASRGGCRLCDADRARLRGIDGRRAGLG